MFNVFTKAPGAEIRIGNFGVATNNRPAVVPEAVAEELRADPALRIEEDEPPTKLSAAALKAQSKGKE